MTEDEIKNICHKISEQAFYKSKKDFLNQIQISFTKYKSGELDKDDFNIDLFVSLFQTLSIHNEEVLAKTLIEVLKVSQ